MKATLTLHPVTSLSISIHITPSGRVLFYYLLFSGHFRVKRNSPQTKIPYPLGIIVFGGKLMKTKTYTNNDTSKERN